jgi:hypothetical protein
MNRPSHWILASFAVLGTALVVSGRASAWLQGTADSTAPAVSAGSRATTDSSVRRQVPLVAGTSVRGRIEGRVIDRFGWPIAGVDVRSVDRPATGVHTDSDGRFALAIDGLGTRPIRFSTADHVHVEELAASAPARTVVLSDPIPWAAAALEESLRGREESRRAARLAGETFVRQADGSAAAGAWVAIPETGAFARSDELGRVRIPLVAGRPVTLIGWDDEGNACLNGPITPRRGAGLVPLPELALESGLSVQGRIHDPDGDPIAAPVRVRSGEFLRESVASADGTFAVSGLVAGDYELEVLPHRGWLGRRERVSVSEGSGVLDIMLHRDRPLQLRVVDRGSRALPGIHVVARDDADRRAHGVTDRDGEVMVRGLSDRLVEFEVRDARLERLLIDSWAEEQSVLVVAAP